MKQFGEFIRRLRYLSPLFLLRCLIFGYTKTKQKDMEKILELEHKISELKKNRFSEINIDVLKQINDDILKIQVEIDNIRKNYQYKYALQYSWYVLDFDNNKHLNISEPKTYWSDHNINYSGNLYESDINDELIPLKLEIEKYLTYFEIVDVTNIVKMVIKRL